MTGTDRPTSPAAAPADALNLLAGLTAGERARPALLLEDRTVSYGELADTAGAVAAHLTEHGLCAGDRAAFVAAPTADVVLLIAALAALGVTLVPVHPRLSPAEARVVIEVARAGHHLDPAEVVLASREHGRFVATPPSPPLPVFRPGGGRGAPALPHEDREEHAPERDDSRGPDARAGLSRPSPATTTLESPAVDPVDPGGAGAPVPCPPAPPFAIVSTSGTTGRPKGAVLSRRAFLASAEASAKNLGWREGDRWLICMPLAHVGGLSIVTRCLAARRAMVLLPRFDPGLVLDAVRRRGVTLLSVVPTMLHALLEVDTEGVLESLRALLLGGAAAPPALLDACAARRVRALTTYGLTEACSQVTTQAPRDPSVRLAGSGAPLEGVEVSIVDNSGAPLPPGVPGRILVGGPVLFDGYLAEDGHSMYPVRVPPPRVVSSRGAAASTRAPSELFDTGDIGELDEAGHLHVHVRRTDLIVTGGENVYPAEVEQALERCPGAVRALVFGIPDERWGQIVGAVVQVAPALLADESASAALVRALGDLSMSELAPHKRPRRLGLAADLPLTASGKVDRRDAFTRHAALLQPIGDRIQGTKK